MYIKSYFYYLVVLNLQIRIYYYLMTLRNYIFLIKIIMLLQFLLLLKNNIKIHFINFYF